MSITDEEYRRIRAEVAEKWLEKRPPEGCSACRGPRVFRCLDCDWEWQIDWAERHKDEAAYTRRVVESHQSHARGSTLWHRLERGVHDHPHGDSPPMTYGELLEAAKRETGFVSIPLDALRHSIEEIDARSAQEGPP